MGALIWLASYPKSGNTWMRSFLHNFLTNAEAPVDINDMTKFCAGEAVAQLYQGILPKVWAETTREDIARLRPAVQAHLTRLSPDSVFVKTHNRLGDWLGQPLINMSVTAGAIYIIRNPLDVVVSARAHFGLDIDAMIEMMGFADAESRLSDKLAPEVYGSWSRHVESWTQQPSPQLHVVRYEDLLFDPTTYFGQIARFLGIDPPTERLERAIRHSSFETLRGQEEERGFREKSKAADHFFRAGKADAWRDELSETQIRRIISDHREQMLRFGYVPEAYL